jgi:CubicO group peptidase (beta-lactamase class C family)
LIPAELFGELGRGTSANPAYGLTWWLNADLTPAQRAGIPELRDNLDGLFGKPGLEGMSIAAGAFKQRLYIIPARRMVVVRYGNSVGPQFNDARFLGLLLGTIREKRSRRDLPPATSLLTPAL